MVESPRVGFLYLTASSRVAFTHLRLLRVIVNVSVAGALTTVYEGLDAASGRVLCSVTAPVTLTNTVDLGGVYADRGLFVNMAADVTDVTLVFELAGGPKLAA